LGPCGGGKHSLRCFGKPGILVQTKWEELMIRLGRAFGALALLALFWIDPKEQLIAIYMVQVNDGDRVMLRNQFRTMVQSAIIN
jgi:hypothetical protein